MAKILITGGCGFFGTWILAKLLDQKHTIHVCDFEYSTHRWKLILSDHQIRQTQFHKILIEESDQVSSLFQKIEPETVIHLAALQVPTCRSQPI